VVARLIGQKALGKSSASSSSSRTWPEPAAISAWAAAARAAGDGYTILFVSSSYNRHIRASTPKAPYDPDKDLAPVTKAAGSPNALFVNPQHPGENR